MQEELKGNIKESNICYKTITFINIIILNNIYNGKQK